MTRTRRKFWTATMAPMGPISSLPSKPNGALATTSAFYHMTVMVNINSRRDRERPNNRLKADLGEAAHPFGGSSGALGAYNTWLVEEELSRSNGIMVQVSVEEIQRDLTAYLQRVEAGETVVIVRAGQPVAEIKPVASATKQLRPFGLCAGEFTVPEDFDAPLPEDILNAFEGA